MHVAATVDAHCHVVSLHGVSLVGRSPVRVDQDHGGKRLRADAAAEQHQAAVLSVAVGLMLFPVPVLVFAVTVGALEVMVLAIISPVKIVIQLCNSNTITATQSGRL